MKLPSVGAFQLICPDVSSQDLVLTCINVCTAVLEYSLAAIIFPAVDIFPVTVIEPLVAIFEVVISPVKELVVATFKASVLVYVFAKAVVFVFI